MKKPTAACVCCLAGAVLVSVSIWFSYCATIAHGGELHGMHGVYGIYSGCFGVFGLVMLIVSAVLWFKENTDLTFPL